MTTTVSVNMAPWRGRVDAAEGPLGLRWHQVVRPLEASSAAGAVALLGFACDAGVARNDGRIGASEGPGAIRGMLANLPLRRSLQLVDAGDVRCEGAADDEMEQAQEALAGRLAALLGQGLLPIVLGGGHEMAYGSFGGLARHLDGAGGAPRIGIINLDAHFDLRVAQRANSGTPFRQISEDCAARGWPFHYCCLGVSEYANTPALFERARTLGALWRRDVDMDPGRLDANLGALAHFMAEVDHLYLTVCLDVLPASVAPGVSAPAARGVALEVIEPLIDAAVASGKLRLADVAEMNPRFDIDGHTARVAARLVARVADGMADVVSSRVHGARRDIEVQAADGARGGCGRRSQRLQVGH